MWIRSLGREDPLELLLFSYWVMFHSLWPHGLQHIRLPSPSPCPRVCSNSCPLSWWVESGNPGQYSCLENSLGWGAWWTTVHEVAESGMAEHTHTWRILVKGIPVMFLTWTLRRQYYSLLLKKRTLLSVLMSPCPSISTGILSIYVFSPVYSFFFLPSGFLIKILRIPTSYCTSKTALLSFFSHWLHSYFSSLILH